MTRQAIDYLSELEFRFEAGTSPERKALMLQRLNQGCFIVQVDPRAMAQDGRQVTAASRRRRQII